MTHFTAHRDVIKSIVQTRIPAGFWRIYSDAEQQRYLHIAFMEELNSRIHHMHYTARRELSHFARHIASLPFKALWFKNRI